MGSRVVTLDLTIYFHFVFYSITCVIDQLPAGPAPAESLLFHLLLLGLLSNYLKIQNQLNKLDLI